VRVTDVDFAIEEDGARRVRRLHRDRAGQPDAYDLRDPDYAFLPLRSMTADAAPELIGDKRTRRRPAPVRDHRLQGRRLRASHRLQRQCGRDQVGVLHPHHAESVSCRTPRASAAGQRTSAPCGLWLSARSRPHLPELLHTPGACPLSSSVSRFQTPDRSQPRARAGSLEPVTSPHRNRPEGFCRQRSPALFEITALPARSTSVRIRRADTGRKVAGLNGRQFRKPWGPYDAGVVGSPPPDGRALSWEDRKLLVAAYRRTNLTMRQPGPLFGIAASELPVAGPAQEARGERHVERRRPAPLRVSAGRGRSVRCVRRRGRRPWRRRPRCRRRCGPPCHSCEPA
jgi:hypothetical protein